MYAKKFTYSRTQWCECLIRAICGGSVKAHSHDSI